MHTYFVDGVIFEWRQFDDFQVGRLHGPGHVRDLQAKPLTQHGPSPVRQTRRVAHDLVLGKTVGEKVVHQHKRHSQCRRWHSGRALEMAQVRKPVLRGATDVESLGKTLYTHFPCTIGDGR